MGYISFVEQINQSGTTLLYRAAIQALPAPTVQAVEHFQLNLQQNTLGLCRLLCTLTPLLYPLMKEEVQTASSRGYLARHGRKIH